MSSPQQQEAANVVQSSRISIFELLFTAQKGEVLPLIQQAEEVIWSEWLLAFVGESKEKKMKMEAGRRVGKIDYLRETNLD